LAPALGTPTPTSDGFTAQISNYDAPGYFFTWASTVTGSGSVAISGSGQWPGDCDGRPGNNGVVGDNHDDAHELWPRFEHHNGHVANGPVHCGGHAGCWLRRPGLHCGGYTVLWLHCPDVHWHEHSVHRMPCRGKMHALGTRQSVTRLLLRSHQSIPLS
jgi:hypothetical protein